MTIMTNDSVRFWGLCNRFCRGMGKIWRSGVQRMEIIRNFAANKLKTNYAKDFINGRIRAGERIDNEWSKENSS